MNDWIFAVLGQTGIEHCPEGRYEPTWLDVQPTLGFIPSGGATERSATLMDQAVLACGQALNEAPARPPLTFAATPCPMIQMRSDWVNTPRGIRVQRSASPDIAHFHATSVRRLDELTIEHDGAELCVRFVNPLPFPLRDVLLCMHYEGCYGKPGTVSRSSDRVTLEPGAVLTHRFPTIVSHDHPGPRKGGPTAREHLAAALELSMPEQHGPEHARAWTDLAVSLRALGLSLTDPRTDHQADHS